MMTVEMAKTLVKERPLSIDSAKNTKEGRLASMVDEALLFLGVSLDFVGSPVLGIPNIKLVKVNGTPTNDQRWASGIFLASEHPGASHCVYWAKTHDLADKRRLSIVSQEYLRAPSCSVEQFHLDTNGSLVFRRKTNFLYDRKRGWNDPGGERYPKDFGGDRIAIMMTEEAHLPASICWLTYLMKERVCRVKIGYPEMPSSVQLDTDFTGVSAWFKMRDLGYERDRRAALLHWVREHMRQSRDDPDAKIKVREHLRGVDSFKWFGLDCKISLSEMDVRKNEGLVAEAIERKRKARRESRRRLKA